MALSDRPCVSWSTKLNTSAVTPSWARWAGSRRSKSPSPELNTFSYRTGTGRCMSSWTCSVRSSASCALRLSSSDAPQARRIRCRQRHAPAREVHHALAPFAPRERRAPPSLAATEPRDEIARPSLPSTPVAFERPGDDREDLARLDRLHEVVVH